MDSQLPARTQKRMEKKRFLLMIGLVLSVSMASFFLGIVVGKQRPNPTVAGQENQAVKRIPVVADKAAAKPPVKATSTMEAAKTNLTFYETLPRSQGQPLGTGINRRVSVPPPTSHKGVATAAAVSDKVAVAPMVVPSSAAVPVVAPPPATSSPAPNIAGGGKVAVQVASFRNKPDAEGLAGKLRKKGFSGFVLKVEIPGKGTWYRTMVGPYGDRQVAAPVAQRIRTEEKLEAFVKKL